MGRIKLTPEKIRNIYKRLDNGETQQSIANRYGVSRGHISKIKLGRNNNPPAHARWYYINETYNNKKDGND